MKERLRNLSVRLMALVTSVVLVLVCTLSTGIIVDAAVADPYANVDFETYLTQQGFPESYKVKLRELHQKYPYWKFEAQQTGMDWNDVIQAESKLGLNLTENSNPSSWKSTQEGAYDWDTGNWIALDSGEEIASVPENTETEMETAKEVMVSEPVMRNTDSESTTKKQNTADASKYDKKETTVATAVTDSVKKQIFIILSCVTLAGISAGAAYFLKGFGRK